jgi:hypothetical protein
VEKYQSVPPLASAAAILPCKVHSLENEMRESAIICAIPPAAFPGKIDRAWSCDADAP